MNKQQQFIMVYDLMSHLVISITFLCGLSLGTVFLWSFVSCSIGLFLVVTYLFSYGRFLSCCEEAPGSADPFKRTCQIASYGAYLCFIVFLINTTRGIFVL